MTTPKKCADEKCQHAVVPDVTFCGGGAACVCEYDKRAARDERTDRSLTPRERTS